MDTRSLEDHLSANVHAPLSSWDDAVRMSFDEQTQRARALSSMLPLLGPEAFGGALWRLVYLLNIIAKDHGRGGLTATRQEHDGKSDLELKSEMMSAFQADLSPSAAKPQAA